ncbi:PKD domain-containing protein [Methanofollis formosanus]|uniref:PKD domain-containing protein n=1 Tax=Methanofollis formosanus TaxID=299308 RepID=A0A8G1A3G6_9EURY|nr:PKD domain-containing protein [Methanofollis formosanus]QYZ79392.1 PKD domain-containing protein [Methanofollis formosanus]
MSTIIMRRWLHLVAYLLMAVCCCAGTATAAEPTNITGPTTIDSPGIYCLNHSFFGPYNDTFITITADDVILDGHGWMIKSNGSSPAGTGILVDRAKNVTIACTLLNNFEEGCVVSGGSEVTLWGVNAFNSGSVGIKLDGATNCIVDSCRITENNGTGLEIINGLLNMITNNYFENEENVKFTGTVQSNFWNRTNTTKTNILGGSFIGGNVWTNPARNGWSDTCADTNKDGFCDEAYELNEVNVDFLPLALDQPAPLPLEVAFEADVTSGEAPLTVQFIDQSTGNPLKWGWDFGDSATSTEQNPIHVYETAGTYDVTLTVSRGEEKKEEVRTAYIKVTEPAPASLEANFTADITAGEAPFRVQFNDTSIGKPITWTWDFGDGANSSLKDPVHYYQTAGTYNVSLTVSDGTNSDTHLKADYIDVAPSSLPLAANFTSNETSGDAPFVVEFLDLSTGNPTGWEWDFGDDGNSSLQNPVHTYLETGTYNVTLTVSNSTTNNTLVLKDYIVVAGPGPEPLAANFTADMTSGRAPLTVHFTDTSTGNVSAWQWSFGDGTATSSLQHPTYVYKKAGTYSVSLTVSDGTTNDTMTRTDSIIVKASSSSSRGSGSGGSSSRSNIGVSSGLKTGDSTVFRFSGMGVSEIEITAADRIDGIRVSLEKLSKGPEGLGEPVYQYLLANMTYAEGENLDEIVFFFDLPWSWLQKYGIGVGDVVLWRFHDGIWNPLKTELVKETETKVYYRAVTPGFSYFAIAGGKGMTVIPGDTAPRVGADAGETPTSEGPGETTVTETVPSEPAGNATETATTPQPSPLGVVGAAAALVVVGFVVLKARRP